MRDTFRSFGPTFIAHPYLSLVAVFLVLVFIWLIFDRLNRFRIRDYLTGQGGQVIQISWNPFGYGWFGDRSSDIYRVRYRDRDGVVRESQCKTGIFTGVYFSNERILHSSTGRSPVMNGAAAQVATHNNPRDKRPLFEENRLLREENRRLREELERLQGRQNMENDFTINS